jgi:hypothetical protein
MKTRVAPGGAASVRAGMVLGAAVVGIVAIGCGGGSSSSPDAGSGKAGATASGGVGGGGGKGTAGAAGAGIAGAGGHAPGGAGGDAAGAAGAAGSGGRAGAGGGAAGASAGTSGAAGTGGAAGKGGGGGATGVAGNGAAGSGGQGGAATSCIEKLWSGYLQRTDGSLVYFTGSKVVLDDATGMPLTGVVSLQDNDYQGAGCAALSDGTVKCWLTMTTMAAVGQLGNGTTAASSVTFRATPVVATGGTPLANVRAMAHGDYGTAICAVTTTGQLYCWGDLSWMVNNGTTMHTGSAQLITADGTSALTGVDQAVLGNRQACVLREGTSAKEVWCWGYAGADELGQGDTTNHQYPVKVGGLTNPTSLALAPIGSTGTTNYNDATVCAMDGANIRCWGSNVLGAAGVNSSASAVASPSPVVDKNGAAIDNVVDLEPGYGAFTALRGDGTMWRWGNAVNPYAAAYAATGVIAVGYGGDQGFGPLYETSDGAYHNDKTTVPVSCPSP